MNLSQKHCIPLEKGALPLFHSETMRLLSELQEWKLSADEKSIVKECTFKNFAHAFDFAKEIADIAASSAKIVQLRASRGTAVLETYGEIALGPYAKLPVGKSVKLQPEKLAEVLMDLMREANVTARSGGISIPFSASLISVLEMPK